MEMPTLNSSPPALSRLPRTKADGQSPTYIAATIWDAAKAVDRPKRINNE